MIENGKVYRTTPVQVLSWAGREEAFYYGTFSSNRNC